MSFAAATAMSPTEPDRWQGMIPPRWDIMGNANGGYLLALIGRSMASAAGKPDPASITAYYLRPAPTGVVHAETQTIKTGRLFTTVSATLTMEKPIVTATGIFSDLSANPDDRSLVLTSVPDYPEPDECIPVLPTEGFPPPIMAQVDLRLVPADDFTVGTNTSLLMRGWLKLADDEPWDSLSLLMAADIFPPTIFNSHLGTAWVPTLELTVHVRQPPAPGWLRCHFSSRFVTGGFVEEDGLMWDSTGALVAQSRQISLLPRPS